MLMTCVCNVCWWYDCKSVNDLTWSALIIHDVSNWYNCTCVHYYEETCVCATIVISNSSGFFAVVNLSDNLLKASIGVYYVDRIVLNL